MSDSVDAVELSRARQSRLRRCLMLEFLRRKIPSGTSAERTRTWASGRCLSASESGIYRQTNGSPKTRRRVNREPSNN